MKKETTLSISKRLSRIEGQVKGVAKMIDDDRYCIDIVRQIQAIKSALISVEGIVLNDHLDTCVETALKSDNIEQRREKVEELVAVLGGRKK
ncbi:MAG: metal-sensitive transcriptional regulator [Hellea sp.]|nr:metal-sensitive transcriptional regulator [Hellea sp.]MDG1523007.1 metal-sensitive transcriptional regulator [Hellea sp.]MDG1666660.1 metal-sensitive transcriptional regulator [Hellea sp.]MDG2362072.1 metal-sensitive transcriptional regulator [Hellea sp.]